VERRLQCLLDVHLLERNGEKWNLSSSGLRLVRIFVALKQLFGHPIG